ncbi:hypothetical protein [Streptomyces flavofungini]|uniref:hypothetical protein n=1 Tax=Streptomyces flavofungini TaxID=68200 RepID=UPI0025B11DF0|nr:hypothetical protein [Streptomyces flavofungini]WJV47667.1 hypothetical protein QUY26_20335 [Streptomyces flavofungini]
MTNTIPALDTTTNQHLPYLVEHARQHPGTETVSVLIRHTELTPGQLVIWWPVSGADHHIEAGYDSRQISLNEAETRLRAQLAERGMTVTAFLNEDGPLTAAQRALTPDEGLGARRTTPIETTMRAIDCGDLPWLGAEVVVSDYRSQAYGRHTQLWLHNNKDTAELSIAEARSALREARAFFDRFETLIDYAETVAVDDFEGDPEIAAADREATDARIKARTAELLAAEAGR